MATLEQWQASPQDATWGYGVAIASLAGFVLDAVTGLNLFVMSVLYLLIPLQLFIVATMVRNSVCGRCIRRRIVPISLVCLCLVTAWTSVVRFWMWPRQMPMDWHTWW